MKNEDKEVKGLVQGIYNYDAAGLAGFVERYPGKDFGETMKLVRARGQAEGWIDKRKGKGSDSSGSEWA